MFGHKFDAVVNFAVNDEIQDISFIMTKNTRCLRRTDRGHDEEVTNGISLSRYVNFARAE